MPPTTFKAFHEIANYVIENMYFIKRLISVFNASIYWHNLEYSNSQKEV